MLREQLREYSTLFGFASALVCAIVAGSVSHWSPFWMAATAIAGIFFFPRCFYGFKEARALRDADFELGSGKSVSWYVEPPPNQLKCVARRQARGPIFSRRERYRGLNHCTKGFPLEHYGHRGYTRRRRRAFRGSLAVRFSAERAST
jgi:hypothetical protein